MTSYHEYMDVKPCAGQTAYVFVELESLVHLAREPVDEETPPAVLPAFAVVRLRKLAAHGVLEELDGDLHWHDLALADVFTDEVAELGAFTVLLGTQKVAR